MGSSSSKTSGQNAASGPVANVNNGDISGFPQKNVKTEDQGGTLLVNNTDAHKDFGRQSPLKPIESNKKDKEKERKEREKEMKRLAKSENRDRGESAKNWNNQTKKSALEFEEDSDFNDDIDEVLKIPLASDPSKEKKKDKEKKNKRDKDKSQNIENEDSDYNRQYDFGAPVSRNEAEPLPETYAQRLQRKQYKLQQEMLIREKTIMRVSQEWDQHDGMEVDEPVTGFDPSKFRRANKGQDAKKELFQPVEDEFKTPRYLQTSGQELDDVDVDRRRSSPQRQLPSYNQSEIDLMAELERDIL